MSFEIIFAIYPFIYPPTHEVQLVQPQYSAQDLGTSIAIGEKQNLSINTIQSQTNPVYQLQLNSETLSEENLLNPWMSIKLKKIEHKSGQIDSVSTDIRIGFFKSTLKLYSQDIKAQTQLTLLSGGGFSFKMKGELQMRGLKPKIEPVFRFKRSLNWFEEEIESKDKKISLQQTMRFGVPRRLTLNSTDLNSLRTNKKNEIYDSPENIQDLTSSLNSLTTSKLAKKTIFSLEADLEDLSAELNFPVPGVLRDELEFKIKTNLPEVMVNGEDLSDNMKSTLSLKYGVDINDATKLEIQSSYNLRTTSHQIILMTILGF